MEARVVGTLERMAKLRKKDIVCCKEILWGRLRKGYRRWTDRYYVYRQTPIDKIDIDPRANQLSFSDVMALDFEEIEPDYAPGKDYTSRPRSDVSLYHAQNPLNDLFSFPYPSTSAR